MTHTKTAHNNLENSINLRTLRARNVFKTFKKHYFETFLLHFKATFFKYIWNDFMPIGNLRGPEMHRIQNQSHTLLDQEREAKIFQNIPCTHSMASWWKFPDVLHCQDGKTDCKDVLYIFSVRISVSHECWSHVRSHMHHLTRDFLWAQDTEGSTYHILIKSGTMNWFQVGLKCTVFPVLPKISTKRQIMQVSVCIGFYLPRQRSR